MNKRIYNVFFHTHTIVGIIIAALLYVIFFSGSFSFFRDEIAAWERNEPVAKNQFQKADMNLLLDSLQNKYSLYSRDITINKRFDERQLAVSLSAPKDTTIEGHRTFFYLDMKNGKTASYAENFSLGRFFYRLHFFTQLNYWGRSGYLLSGFIAFFFLFTIITGVIIHWDKIISNFYLFRPKIKLKNVWTEAHTALGILGLPFQFMFALTGAFLIIGIIVMAPPIASLLYDGNNQKMNEDFGLIPTSIPMDNKRIEKTVDFNDLVSRAKTYWKKDFDIETLSIRNFGDKSMQMTATGHYPYTDEFIGQGKLTFDAISNKVIKVNPPEDASYITSARQVIDRLHYGDFGGLALRVVYFILGIISCFVMISGIFIYVIARDKKRVNPKKRKFNNWLGHLYMAGCLSMYPATAFSFIAVKCLIHGYHPDRSDEIAHYFFYAWLLFGLFLLIKRNHYFSTKITLITGGILGLLVPIANGIISDNWLWETYINGYWDIFFIDAFWIGLGISSLIIAGLMTQKRKRDQKKTQTKKQKIPQPAIDI